MKTQVANLPHSQRGLTAISWVIIIAILGFQGVMAMNVIPVYINDASVKSIVKGLEKDPELRGASARKIREVINKRLRINNLYDIKKDSIKIKKARNGYSVNITYEPRGTLVGNLDYIITFSHDGFVPR